MEVRKRRTVESVGAAAGDEDAAPPSDRDSNTDPAMVEEGLRVNEVTACSSHVIHHLS